MQGCALRATESFCLVTAFHTEGRTMSHTQKNPEPSAPQHVIDDLLARGISYDDIQLGMIHQQAQRRSGVAVLPLAVIVGADAADFNRHHKVGSTTAKMLLGSIHKSARAAPITVTDQVALIQLQDTMDEVGKAYDNHEFYKGYSALNRWVNNDLSAFYIEALKDRLYCGDGGGVLAVCAGGRACLRRCCGRRG